MAIGGKEVVGVSHAISGIPCQDNIAFYESKNRHFSIAALSDGAGSAEQSDVGSRAITEALVAELSGICETQELSENLFKNCVTSVIYRVREFLSEKAPLESFHATVLCVACYETNLYGFHLGDGGISVLSESDEYLVFSRSNPENGEYANETFFFTLDNWEQYGRFFSIKSPSMYCLASDGVDPLIWDPHIGIRQRFLVPIISESCQNPENIEELLERVLTDPRMDESTNDDKSMVLWIGDSSLSSRLQSREAIDETKIFDNSEQKLAEELSHQYRFTNQNETQIHGLSKRRWLKFRRIRGHLAIFFSLASLVIFLSFWLRAPVADSDGNTQVVTLPVPNQNPEAKSSSDQEPTQQKPSGRGGADGGNANASSQSNVPSRPQVETDSKFDLLSFTSRIRAWFSELFDVTPTGKDVIGKSIPQPGEKSDKSSESSKASKAND